MTSGPVILNVPTGLVFEAGSRTVGLDALSLGPAEWAVLTPAREALGSELATVVARVLSTLASPKAGQVELFGRSPSAISYLELLKLRTRIGFVQGHGGLLSNRTLRDNIGLPVSVHAGLDHAQEDQVISQSVASFDLTSVQHKRPHEVDGATRFRTCVARALVLDPAWLVLEGVGDFEAQSGGSSTWARLLEYRERSHCAAVVCLSRHSPAFETWFAEHGGRVIRYRLFSEAPPRLEERT